MHCFEVAGQNQRWHRRFHENCVACEAGVMWKALDLITDALASDACCGAAGPLKKPSKRRTLSHGLLVSMKMC